MAVPGPPPPDAPPARATRWWLNTAIARRAFGISGQPPDDALPPLRTPNPLTSASAARPGPARAGPDLDDPDQCDLGDYRLIELIGRGGMGMVYKARQLSLQRDVAIKLLDAGIWSSPELVAGLYREARHAARLQHPSIVAVYGVGEHRGQVWFAMQYIDGITLAERIDRDGPLPAEDAVRMLRAIADAVDHAHRLGILHLDLKPGNVLVDADGAPHISDFGLARRIDSTDGVENDCVSGTPSYMAPEQVRLEGPRLSWTTDVWGLGAILYESLTGHPPFEGDDDEALVRDVARAAVRPPREHRPLPRDLEAIVMRCLQRVPSRRYPTARILADDLSRFLEDRPVSARRLNPLQRLGRWARRSPHDAALAGLVLIVLLAVAAMLLAD